LFIGHPDAGDRSAIIYSIIVSCQRRGIDPLAYMRDVLSRLPSMTNQDDQPGRPDTGPLATSGSPRLVGNYALHPQASLM
jgi:hypothetical protein